MGKILSRVCVRPVSHILYLVIAGNRSSFHSHTITDLNYANLVKLNDSSNNRLLTDLPFFLSESCLARHLVVSGTITGHS